MKMGKALKRLLLALLAAILVFVIAAGALMLHLGSKLNVQPATGNDNKVSPSGISNILLIGVDNDYAPGMEQLGNADGIILATINEKTNTIVLTSFMRDIKVNVPGHGTMKLTRSYHTGGAPLLIETLESNFDINIDSYVLVNYINVVDIVDAAGGIQMEVNRDELYYMQPKIENINSLLGQPSGSNIIPLEQAGSLTLNGVQTAAFMRVRMAGNNDLERTERARRVLMALKDKVLSGSIQEMYSFAETAMSCITTDMEHTQLLTLAMNAAKYLKYDMNSARIPIDNSFYYSQDGNAFVVIDFEENIHALHEYIN